MTVMKDSVLVKEVGFREAIPADERRLIQVLINDISGESPNNPGNDIPATLRCPAAKIFIAETDEEIIATLTASWNGRNGELRYLWIAPSVRRSRTMEKVLQGLFDNAASYLRAVGMTRVLFFLRADENLQQNERMYRRKFGAKVVGPVVMAFDL